MRKSIAIAFGLMSAMLGSGCATITRGTTEAWIVQSEPAGASVRLSTGQTCTTPCTLELKRKTGFGVEIEKPGYERVMTQVVSSTAGAGAAGMAGNVIFGGLIGAGVDAATGSTKELKPNPLVVNLVPMRAQAIAPAPMLAQAVAPQSTSTSEAGPSPNAEPAPTGYADSASKFASQYRCDSTLTLESKDSDREVYRATCPSGTVRIECWAGICRML